MKLEYLKLEELKPYERNAKKHPKKQVNQIIESINEFGFNDPLAVDENNVIIEGHGRYEALKELGYDAVPVIRLEGLTDEQKRAYILVHNKLTLNSDFDLENLNLELQEITGIDMSQFDFEIPELEVEPEDYKQETIERLRNIENLEVASFPQENKYGIPELNPVKKLEGIEEWIPFNYVLTEKHPENKGVHFFIHDYQFERVWNSPELYVEKLKKFKAVMTPDFSPYLDMPLALRIYNHYRKMWCGKYWQSNGITVIPVVRASEEDAEYCFEGIPKNGIIAISTMGLMKDAEYKKGIVDGYEIDILKPKKLLIYTNSLDYDLFENMKCDYEVIGSYSSKRWKKTPDSK